MVYLEPPSPSHPPPPEKNNNNKIKKTFLFGVSAVNPHFKFGIENLYVGPRFYLRTIT